MGEIQIQIWIPDLNLGDASVGDAEEVGAVGGGGRGGGGSEREGLGAFIQQQTAGNLS